MISVSATNILLLCSYFDYRYFFNEICSKNIFIGAKRNKRYFFQCLTSKPTFLDANENMTFFIIIFMTLASFDDIPTFSITFQTQNYGAFSSS